MILPQALWDGLTDARERREARRVGMKFVCEVPAGARLSSCEHGIVVACPDGTAFLIRRDGTREDIPAGLFSDFSHPVDTMTSPPV